VFSRNAGYQGRWQTVMIQQAVMIHLLTAIGLSPGGSSTVHIYTQTVHKTIQNKQYTEQHKHFGRVRTVPRLFGLYPGICLTTEEKSTEIHQSR
jgi:hypothetical protein